MYLFDKIETLREIAPDTIKPVPEYITSNLNPSKPLREYQIKAISNFITYFETDNLHKDKMLETLFHMATGSGKTLIMASLILYLYKQGYNNFLFFVNSSQIVKKTISNFIDTKSSKYLFADRITIDNQNIKINKVSNFELNSNTDINICFVTIQGLQSNLLSPKENSITYDDFADNKIVFISDEAHHINAETKLNDKKKLSKEDKAEIDNYNSWESTIRRIFYSNKNNIMLEFTATFEDQYQSVKTAYEDKVICKYDLTSYRAEKYSKEIKTLRTELSLTKKELIACLLSQFRLKVFQKNKISAKPVILFKSQLIKESIANKNQFIDYIRTLESKDIDEIKEIAKQNSEMGVLNRMFHYYDENGISSELLVQELKDSFNDATTLSVNEDGEVEELQEVLNSLEDENNPYRAIFAVNKLNEGWDVLNLFDIVRLYETRQGGNKIGEATTSEAQLIGRGARYYPFSIGTEDEKDRRKYDLDQDNELRICEELYFHCQDDPKYIAELNAALKEIGINLTDTIVKKYQLKESFIEDELYQNGLIFVNERKVIDRKSITGILPSIKNKVYEIKTFNNKITENVSLGTNETIDSDIRLFEQSIKIKEIYKINPAIITKAMANCKNLTFNVIKHFFPNVESRKEFIVSTKYMGDIKVIISSYNETPTISDYYEASCNVCADIDKYISQIEEVYEGSKEFHPERINNTKKFNWEKTRSYPTPKEFSEGDGVSQNENWIRTEWKIDLSQEDWYAFNDNYGTDEEKSMVAYIKKFIPQLKSKYDKIWLLRNERAMHLYSFNGGERFEPDYILFLQKNKVKGYEQYQIFVEPKGSQLVEKDKWKEDFLLELKSTSISKKVFVDDNDYFIWGMHFYEYNDVERMNKFNKDVNALL